MWWSCRSRRARAGQRSHLRAHENSRRLPPAVRWRTACAALRREALPTSRRGFGCCLSSLAISVSLIPLLYPRAVEFHVLLEIREPQLDYLWIEARRIDWCLFQRGQVAELLDHESLPLLREAPVEEELCGIGMRRRLRHSGGIGIDRRTFGSKQNFDRRPVALLREHGVVKKRPHDDLAAHQRVGHRGARGIKHGIGCRLPLPIILPQHMALEHDSG